MFKFQPASAEELARRGVGVKAPNPEPAPAPAVVSLPVENKPKKVKKAKE